MALTPANRAVAEDRGLAFIEGARARHCRITVDGATIRRALPEIDLLVGDDRPVALARRRSTSGSSPTAQLGQVDGQLTRAGARARGGRPRWPTLRFRITAVDRGLPISVLPPAP